MSSTLTIEQRFNGPPDSANGGYAAGVLARYIDGTSAVRLHAPPPLETEMTVEGTGEGLTLKHGEQLIATGRPTEIDIDVPLPPTLAEAEAASTMSPCHTNKMFITCFVCAPARANDGGLCVHAGPLEDGVNWATPWLPDASLANDSGHVAPEYIWSALDCPGVYACRTLNSTAMLLGELAVRIEGAARPGEPHIVTAWPLGHDGRKYYSGSALFAETGERLAVAKHIWIELS